MCDRVLRKYKLSSSKV